MKTKHNGFPVSLQIAAALLLLTALSICICSGMYARYTTVAVADDSARVASFSVVPGEAYTTPHIIFDDMAPGDEKSYSFEITSKSEVAICCTVTLEATDNLPLKFKLNGDDFTVGNAITLYLEPNTASVTLNLTAAWDSADNDLKYLNEIDVVRLIVIAEQVD